MEGDRTGWLFSSLQDVFYTLCYIAIITGANEVERGQELRGIT
jgi:hypothetical protein